MCARERTCGTQLFYLIVFLKMKQACLFNGCNTLCGQTISFVLSSAVMVWEHARMMCRVD